MAKPSKKIILVMNIFFLLVPNGFVPTSTCNACLFVVQRYACDCRHEPD